LIPLRDHNPSGSFPYVTISLIVANSLIFLYEISLGPHLERFLMNYGMVPFLVTHVNAIPTLGFTDVARTFFTSMFLHGGWLHVIGNMWYLWIFGDNVEDRMGHGRFLAFYLVCGLIAGLVHYGLNLHSKMPTIGASGAIAGVLGAYLLCFPRARVDLLIFLFFFIDVVSVPAAFVLLFWFVMQFFSGVFSLGASTAQTAGGVAWWAHIGGFVSGFLLARLCPRGKRSRQTSYRVWFDR
jgi:membrane associated rhomboid family serine protease